MPGNFSSVRRVRPYLRPDVRLVQSKRSSVKKANVVQRNSRVLTKYGFSRERGTSLGVSNLKLGYEPHHHTDGIKKILAREARAERVAVTRQWRRLMELRASIAAGAIPEIITLSNGRRIQVYRSNRGDVSFLASGPKRRLGELGDLGDLRRRMQEGEALALHIEPNTIRTSHSDQTAVRDSYSAAERSRALEVQCWVDDVEKQLGELRETAAGIPPVTPLGGLSHELFGQNPEGKMPDRPKWISLSTWPQQGVEPEETASLSSPPTNGKLLQDGQPWSIPGPASLDDQRMFVEQPGSIAKPALCGSSSPKLDKFIISWTTRFERMCQGKGLDLYVLDERSLGPIIQAYASTIKTPRELHRAWSHISHLPNYSQVQMWEDIMLWCLYNSPYRALRLLNATLWGKKLKPSRYMAIDCLTYLTRHFLSKSKDPDRSVLQVLHNVARKILDKGTDTTERPQPIEDNVIYLLLRHSNDEQARTLLASCLANKVSLHANTLLHFLDWSVKWGTISLSINILQSVAKSEFDMSSDQVQSACVKIVRTRINNDTEYIVQTKIVTELLEMGIVPAIAMYNAIMLNAVEASDFSSAWQMYDVAKANKLAPDSTTYGILLKGAKLSGELDVLEKVIHEVLSDSPAMQDLRLLHDVLAAISSQNLQSRENPRSGYRQMLALYRRYCSLVPLRDLHICGPELQQSPNSNIKVQWPTHWILGQMVNSYAHMRRGEDDLIETYNRYYALASEGHPLVTQLAQTDFTANAFTKAFGARPGTLKHCTTVLKHMLEGPISKSSATDTASVASRTSQTTDVSSAKSFSLMDNKPASDDAPSLSRRFSPPTVRTWSILAGAYLFNGQKLAAEKVMKIMQDRGLRSDKITWNTLISGYAGLQDVNAAVDTFERMQAAGHETDSMTLKGLGRLWDQGRLLDALKRAARPAELDTQMVKKQEKSSIEVMTGELEAERRKQEEAERFLADAPLQLHGVDANLNGKMSKTFSDEETDEKVQWNIGAAWESPQVDGKKRRHIEGVERDPSLDATIQRLAGTAI